MHLLTIFMIGIGLAMDACAVSFAKGMSFSSKVYPKALVLGFAFGLFQALMPIIGWWMGTYFESFITSIEHWLAFFMLGFIGINMIKESFQTKTSDTKQLSFVDVVILAIATSIDALAVGITFAFLQVDIWISVLIIGSITWIISFFAVILGHKIGGKLGNYAELFGGVILLVIGLKILIEHLFF